MKVYNANRRGPRVVSPRSLLRCKHIFITQLEKDVSRYRVEVYDFVINKVLLTQQAFNENDLKRLCAYQIAAYKVPPEAIIRDKTPSEYLKEYNKKWELC